MIPHCVRIEEIEVHNFKNVINGVLNFNNPRKNYTASVVGIYGQNGSGKTTMIDAISLLKYVLSGKKVPTYFSDCINVSKDSAIIKYTFRVTADETEYLAKYEMQIRKDKDESEKNIDNVLEKPKYKTTIVNEKLSCSYKNINENTKMSVIANTNTNSNEIFVPNVKYKILCGSSKETVTNLLVAKKLSLESSTSFLFSRELINTISLNTFNEKSVYSTLFEVLVWYGNCELFVFENKSNGLIQLNALPLSYKINEKNTTVYGRVAIKLDDSTVIPLKIYKNVQKVIEKMNIVLEQVIPGLNVNITNLGEQLLPDGTTGCRVQLTSQKSDRTIPLKYESEGIKKIISILQLLIVMYNSPSITIAIDELDSGVFEYLLGELLRIISEKGKGQLVFTSHDLRPLETLDKGFVAFTTTNPENRYIRLTNVKTNNNLRDFYYRDIILGIQEEQLYEKTKNSDIALAFLEAGE